MRVVGLDFDTIKANLKEYLSTKPGFTDYDFEGSGLSIMLDILAYNTHYNAVVANMLTQEMFLDTAVKKETVALHAKRMGYVPRSVRSARAYVNVEVFPEDLPYSLTLPKGTVFSSAGEYQFDFFTRDDIVIQPTGGRYIFSNVPLFEGTLKYFRYLVDTNEYQRFAIPDKNVDISTLRVSVQKSSTNSKTDVYGFFNNVVDVTSETMVYYLRMTETGLYEIYFGDGVLGKQLENGNIVTMEYAICSEGAPNGATGFVLPSYVSGYQNKIVSTVTPATGGASAESIESIRNNAHLKLLTQNRAVTETDYKVLVNEILPVGDVAVWGGEKNTPPVYGKVFLAITPSTINTILDPEIKKMIKDNLKKKMPMTIIPEIVDPDFTYIEIDTSVYYDPLKTSNSSDGIGANILTTIKSYVTNSLNKFDAQFRYSPLLSMIDGTDYSIVSNITKVAFKKKFTPYVNQSSNYTILFNNPLKSGTVTSNAFYSSYTTDAVYLGDNNGVLYLYSITGAVRTHIRDVGTVDYSTGKLSINDLNIVGYATDISIRVVPLSNDILSVNNNVLTVLDSDISINVIEDDKNRQGYIYTAS